MQLAGDFKNINFANLLSLSFNSKLNGRFTISNTIDLAQLYIKDGQPIFAQLGILIGLDALFEIFLWNDAKFFFEDGVEPQSQPIAINLDVNTIIQEGIEYSKKRVFLNELGVTVNTILIPTKKALDLLSTTQDQLLSYIVENLNGIKTIAQAFEPLDLALCQLIDVLYNLLNQELAIILEQSNVFKELDANLLPQWVLDKLKQKNPDLNQAIVDIVVWNERAKSYLATINDQIEQTIRQISQDDYDYKIEDEDFFKLLNDNSKELFQENEPLFGEFD